MAQLLFEIMAERTPKEYHYSGILYIMLVYLGVSIAQRYTRQMVTESARARRSVGTYTYRDQVNFEIFQIRFQDARTEIRLILAGNVLAGNFPLRI